MDVEMRYYQNVGTLVLNNHNVRRNFHYFQEESVGLKHHPVVALCHFGLVQNSHVLNYPEDQLFCYCLMLVLSLIHI